MGININQNIPDLIYLQGPAYNIIHGNYKKFLYTFFFKKYILYGKFI